MTWQQAFYLFRQYPVDPIFIPHSFTSTQLIIKADCLQKPPSWKRAGWIMPVQGMPDIGEPVEGFSRRIYLATKNVRFEPLTIPFQLQFQAFGWLPDIALTIWEPEEPTGVENQLLEIEKKVEELSRNQRKTLTFTLSNVQYLRHPEEESLTISKFSIPINYKTYEVGRFSLIGSDEIISDPILDAAPNLLTARFTSENRIEPGTISVKIVVQEE